MVRGKELILVVEWKMLGKENQCFFLPVKLTLQVSVAVE